MAAQPTEFSVAFSTQVARVLECTDAVGCITFTVDSGSKGDRSVCLEHHPPAQQRDARYMQAFESARAFLVSCGFEVETYGG